MLVHALIYYYSRAYCIVERDIGRKSRIVTYPIYIWRPRLGCKLEFLRDF